MCGSPRLFAAYRVLRRLSMPRHPPCALLRLISHALQISVFDSPPPAPVALATPSIRQLSKSSTLMRAGTGPCGRQPEDFPPGAAPGRRAYSSLQKGGDPAAGSPTATLLRLRPSHSACLRRLAPFGCGTDFGHSELPWRDGRCVQGPGTYSPRHG